MRTNIGKVYAYMEKHRMLQSGDRLVVGVSGGADSVCLLFLLAEYRKKVPFEMAVVHINHGIRPEAGEDADYVKQLCERFEISFYLECADVRGIAFREGISEEEAGRIVRYEAFRKYAGIWAPGQIVKLAVAHHMGDRAETMLFHLFRGTGSRGLGSIRPVREDDRGLTVIRPLLCLERRQIEEILEAEGISYCQDATNAADDYTRNRIRHHILPYACEQVNEGAVRHLCSAADQLAEIEDYLAQQTRAAMEECVSKKDDSPLQKWILADIFLQQPVLIQKRILMELLLQLSPGHKDIGTVHVEALLALACGETGKSLDLPGGIRAEKSYRLVKLENIRQENRETFRSRKAIQPDVSVAGGDAAAAPSVFSELLLTEETLQGEGKDYSIGGSSFRFQVLPYEKNSIIPEIMYTKWFDYDKIKGNLSIRTRRTGDYLAIRGAGGEIISKKLKDYMITEKLPREERDRLPLLAADSHILWIPGYRISEAYKVDEGTKRILQVEYIQPKRNVDRDKQIQSKQTDLP